MTIRDADRFKDKLEVSLDGRQIFFLFFGGAVVACLVFVLGVMVGKRLEGREQLARRAGTSAAIDPLAALDELSADEAAKDDLAFPAALAGDEKTRKRALDAADLAPARALTPDGTGAILQTMRGAAAKLAEAAPAPTPPPAPVPAAQPKPEAAPAPAPVAAAAPKPDPKVEPDEKKFTLQISSFQERSEADALAAKLSKDGYKPFIVMSDVPEKGIFFRVRVGEYAARGDAMGAKADFEKKQGIIAYVTKI